MEKISRIIPESKRIKTETPNLQPVRPGAPSFGQPEGSSELKDRVSLSAIGVAQAKEAKNVKIVEDLSRNFFMTGPKVTKAEKEPVELQESKIPASSDPAMVELTTESKINSLDNYA